MVDVKRTRTAAVVIAAGLVAAVSVIFGTGGGGHQARADSTATGANPTAWKRCGAVEMLTAEKRM